jgi:CDGSH-type Zn-finger protein
MLKGKRYFWCVCGRSSDQPFCDGSHAGTSFRPRVIIAEKDDTGWLCACKHTSDPPYCDGSHKQFSDQQVGTEGPGAED